MCSRHDDGRISCEKGVLLLVCSGCHSSPLEAGRVLRVFMKPQLLRTNKTQKSHHSKPSTISTGSLQTLLPFHVPPIKLVVSQRSYLLDGVRRLILRRVSRLDAFSGYLVRRSLPGYAAGATTGTRALRPPRSSRTRGRSSQTSYAHSG